MRKVSLFICFIFFAAGSGFSQSVNGIPLKELHATAEYIRVSEKLIVLSKKINIDIEYGQPDKIKNTRVMNENGNQMEFNSMIEVLNYGAPLATNW